MKCARTLRTLAARCKHWQCRLAVSYSPPVPYGPTPIGILDSESLPVQDSINHSSRAVTQSPARAAPASHRTVPPVNTLDRAMFDRNISVSVPSVRGIAIRSPWMFSPRFLSIRGFVSLRMPSDAQCGAPLSVRGRTPDRQPLGSLTISDSAHR